MLSIIMINSFFYNLLNDLVRGVDPAIKGLIAFASFAAALYCFAKGLKVKDKGGLPVKIGYFCIGLLFLGVCAIYTIY